MATDAEIAWAAGLFEGEGSWGVYRRGDGRITVIAALGMTDKDVVGRFHRVVGCGSINLRDNQRPNRKPVYVWSCGETVAVRRLVETLSPWLGQRRRERGESILAETAGIKPHNGKRTHCPNGHPYAGDNLILDVIQREGRGPATVRRCRACGRRDSRERKRRQLGITPDRYRVA